MNKKQILFFFIVLLIGFPLLNFFVPIIKSAGLNGSFSIAPDATFSWNKWFEGTFQDEKNKYWRDNFGFRSDFIRLNNQIQYTLFGNTNAKDVVAGKEECFYEKNYIDSYLGKNCLPDSVIDFETRRIKKVQDYFLNQGKSFVYVIATGKAWVLPEFIPVEMDTIKQISSYEKFLRKFDEYGVKYIDFNGYFARHKKEFNYPLVTKHGTHWSSYGAAIAMDSTIKYLNSQYGLKINPVNVGCNPSDVYNEHDREVTMAFNLIFPLKTKEKTCHPDLSYDSCADCVKYRAIISADSYFWEPYGLRIFQNTLGPFEFWYYNYESWDNNNEKKPFEKPKLLNSMNQTDIFIMMASEMHIECVTGKLIELVDAEQ